jgi:hypothetical protein
LKVAGPCPMASRLHACRHNRDTVKPNADGRLGCASGLHGS